MTRLFLDANVLFTAAHNPVGKAALIIELGQAGLWQLVSSAYAVEEARRNLASKYPQCLDTFERLVESLRFVTDPGGDCPEPLPEKDCPIYRAAHFARADVLLTGDVRDFGFLMKDRVKAGGLIVQTVAEFLEAL